MALTVHLHSFGYLLSGIPQDPAGNGGGFVFDCRGLPNPGKEEQYRFLSGLERPVQQYFQQIPAVAQFAEACALLVEQTMRSYRTLEFTDLMVSFGCTGGQHRSVYQAEWLGQRLAGQDGVVVVVTHQEKPHWLSPSSF